MTVSGVSEMALVDAAGSCGSQHHRFHPSSYSPKGWVRERRGEWEGKVGEGRGGSMEQ